MSRGGRPVLPLQVGHPQEGGDEAADSPAEPGGNAGEGGRTLEAKRADLQVSMTLEPRSLSDLDISLIQRRVVENIRFSFSHL